MTVVNDAGDCPFARFTTVRRIGGSDRAHPSALLAERDPASETKCVPKALGSVPPRLLPA